MTIDRSAVAQALAKASARKAAAGKYGWDWDAPLVGTFPVAGA